MHGPHQAVSQRWPGICSACNVPCPSLYVRYTTRGSNIAPAAHDMFLHTCTCVLQVPIPAWNDIDEDTEMFAPDTLEPLIHWKAGAGKAQFEYIKEYL